MPAYSPHLTHGPADLRTPVATPAAQQAPIPVPSRSPVQRLIDRPMPLLGGWTAIWFAILARHGGISWIFFVKGSSLLFTGNYNGHNRPGFLHLYANYPGLQIGPLAFGVAQGIRNLVPGQPVGPFQGVVTAQLIMSVLGLLTLVIIRRIALLARPQLAVEHRFLLTFLAGGALFMVAWTELAVAYGHLDDSLALPLAAAAVLAAIQGHPVLTGLWIGLAIDAKPWALIFLPVLLLTGGLSRWRTPDQIATPIRASVDAWLIGTASMAAVIAAAWLPFFVAVPRTVRALHYTIANMPNSALHALGVSDPQTPAWDRQAQIALACVLALIAIARTRWPAVLLLAAGARIALDPGVHGYYTPGIMMGTLLWDLLGTRRPLPAWTVISFFALNLMPLLTADNSMLGDFRLYLVVAFSTVILTSPADRLWRPVAAANEGAGRATA